ncbi:hypothetical protein LWI28_014104 [Acer negundo]|uniref:Uncharacterized protein n=1 Tax=Acer negundo TaxID=4023 RepID=A0AAD5IZN0_ACENE|nr:hypothetical protein LWI28_014104 [Acer negundo]
MDRFFDEDVMVSTGVGPAQMGSARLGKWGWVVPCRAGLGFLRGRPTFWEKKKGKDNRKKRKRKKKKKEKEKEKEKVEEEEEKQTKKKKNKKKNKNSPSLMTLFLEKRSNEIIVETASINSF